VRQTKQARLKGKDFEAEQDPGRSTDFDESLRHSVEEGSRVAHQSVRFPDLSDTLKATTEAV